IFATDIDSNAIDVGRRGIYPESISVDVPEKYLKKYFIKNVSMFEIKKSIREILVFAEQNVDADPPFSKLDLISCRNLLIYMELELQNQVIPLFHYALEPGGYMFLGSSESIGGHSSLFSTVDWKAKIFRNEDVKNPLAPAFGMAMPIKDIRQEPEAIEVAKSKKPVDYREVMENLLLADYSPASILINKSGEILFVHGRVGNYLETPPGDATLNIEMMAREGLRFQLSIAIRKAFSKSQEVRYERIRAESNGSVRVVDLVVRPIVEPPAAHGLALVMFHDVPDREAEEISSVDGLKDESRYRVAELERELKSAKEYIQTSNEVFQASNEVFQTSNEELKSTNEELQSSTEELQSTNEELETSREELQSINEELLTLNAELESKVGELAKTNDDMANLLASMEFGTVFLDIDLNVARFTPAAANTIHIVATDVGRPLSHIASNIDYPDLVEDVKQVLATLIPKVREARSVDGLWYSVRITPYRTTANVISGAVITFFDISDRKRLEAQSRLAAVVRDSNDAVTVQDLEGTILAWNKGAERVYGFSQNDALGMNISLLSSESAYLEMKALMKQLTREEIVEPFETRRKTKNGRVLDVLLTVTLLRDQEGRPQAIATTERDISEQKKMHFQLQQMTQMFRNALDPIVIEDMEGVVIDLNTEAERCFGWSRRGLVGRQAETLVPPEHLDHVLELLEQCKRGEEVRDVEGTCQHKSGAAFPVRVTLWRIIDEEGKTTGIAMIASQRALESADVP
ncbi:MAG: PAS domain S-box protein, partial [Candidatus Binatia bacterium]